MKSELISAIEQIEKEKGISKEVLLQAIQKALTSAYTKSYGGREENISVEIDEETGSIDVFMKLEIVEEVEDEEVQISLEEAREIDPSYEIGEKVEYQVTPDDFGRIAAQTAKQVIIQRIREEERNMIYDEYVEKIGDIMTGTVQRKTESTIFINLGKAEGILTAREQVKGERLKANDRIKVYIMDVKDTNKGPQIFLSRSHPGLVKKLFELEVPEIEDGTVEIKSIAREAGSRTKIAVYSEDPNVDPVGACVGSRGARVQSIVDELFDEKIDIINWSEEPEEFIRNVLSPAKVEGVSIDEDEQSATVIVPDHQLSLAIGKSGQNVRLAAKLCGWKIDIKSHTQYEEGEDEEKPSDEEAASEGAVETDVNDGEAADGEIEETETESLIEEAEEELAEEMGEDMEQTGAEEMEEIVEEIKEETAEGSTDERG